MNLFFNLKTLSIKKHYCKNEINKKIYYHFYNQKKNRNIKKQYVSR